TVVREDDGRLTVYDKTQGVQNVQEYLCNVFGLARDDLRVLSPFVGGAFGSGLRPQYQVVLAVLAARELKRSGRLVLTRPPTCGRRGPPGGCTRSNAPWTSSPPNLAATRSSCD